MSKTRWELVFIRDNLSASASGASNYLVLTEFVSNPPFFGRISCNFRVFYSFPTELFFVSGAISYAKPQFPTTYKGKPIFVT
ncbi:MAG: hypothetical protein JWM68_4263 [Verrucomicrobiales bacterium]|nr:hypothetical protein [Verrucomicrobiales bacterium]